MFDELYELVCFDHWINYQAHSSSQNSAPPKTQISFTLQLNLWILKCSDIYYKK